MALVPYYSTRNVIVVNHELRSAIRSIDDLRGRRAAVQQGTAYDSWLLEQNAGRLAANPVTIDYYPTDKAMHEVNDGRAEFTVVGSESSVKWLRNDQVKLDMLFPVGQPVDVGWGIHPAADDLKLRIEQFFADNQRLGSELDRAWFAHRNISLVEYRLLYDSFISSGLSIKTLLQWGIPAALAILAVFCFGVAWNRRIEREVRQRRIAEDRIIALLDQQTRFFSFVAHELRSPLGVIVTGMANLRLGLSDAGDSVRQRIARIAHATQRMSTLIDRHLRLQRLTRTDFSLDLDDCPPSFPAFAALELIAETHPARAIEKSIADDLPAVIRVDSDLVTLAIANLLDNAIKYSPAQSPITLSVERAAPSCGEVVYRVRDCGLGIAAQDRLRLFSIYARQPDNINTGFGIGLALVANIARHHGGSIECVSSPGAGSTFTLRLPIDAEGTLNVNAA
jgi:signal transduction histidine kinase